MDTFPEFKRQIGIIIFNLYEKQIRRPMISKKMDHLRQLSERNDFNQILYIQNQDDEAFNDLRRESFKESIEDLNQKDDDELTGIEMALMFKELQSI